MTDEPKPETNDRKTEFLLKLNSDRVNRLESDLEKNWIAHLILAGVGLALVFHIGKFQELLTSYVTHGAYDQTATATVILAILLYYFMKLGHLLTLYVEASILQQGLLDEYLGKGFETTKMTLRKSSSFYVEAFFSIKELRARDTFWPYMLVTTIVVSLAQATALFLAAQAYHISSYFPLLVLFNGALVIAYVVIFKTFVRPPRERMIARVLLFVAGIATLVFAARSGWLSLILLFAGAVIVTLYVLFWSSNRKFPQTNLAIALGPGLAMAWLILFAAFSH